MILLRANIFLFLWVSCSLSAYSQISEDSNRPVYLGIKSHLTGLIIPHRDTLRDIASTTPRGFQFEISRFNISEKSWRSCNCYARTGFSFSFFDYGNAEELGQSYNLAFFLEPYFNVNNKLSFSYRAGMALSYLNKTYNQNTNPENLFYSSTISYMLNVALQANYKLKPQLTANAGIFYNHISNGGMKQPNLGMNFPTLSVGVDYILNPIDYKLPKYSKDANFNKDLRYYARVIGSLKTVESNDSAIADAQRPVIGVEVGLIKPFSKLNAVIIGSEFISDQSWKLRNERWNADFDHRTINLMLGHGFLLARFTFTQQMGIYVYKNYPNTSSLFFQRYALFYQMGNFMSLGFSMKAHMEIAEIMNIHAGIAF